MPLTHLEGAEYHSGAILALSLPTLHQLGLLQEAFAKKEQRSLDPVVIGFALRLLLQLVMLRTAVTHRLYGIFHSLSTASAHPQGNWPKWRPLRKECESQRGRGPRHQREHRSLRRPFWPQPARRQAIRRQGCWPCARARQPARCWRRDKAARTPRSPVSMAQSAVGTECSGLT